MRLLLAMSRRSLSGFVMFASGFVVPAAVTFVKLLGAIGTFELMAFAGNANQGNGHKKDGEKFHRAASIATRHRKATPKEIEIHG